MQPLVDMFILFVIITLLSQFYSLDKKTKKKQTQMNSPYILQYTADLTKQKAYKNNII